MNLFRVIASGKHSFREEFVSAFFAYLLSPNMDHGLGVSFLATLVRRIGRQCQDEELQQLAMEFGNGLRTDLFSDESGQVDIDLEFRYELPGGASGFIDIITRYKDCYFIIENKILSSSKSKGQLRDQYIGARSRLLGQHGPDFRIVQIYLVPALPGIDGWESSQAFQDEQHDEYQGRDFGVLLYWQPPKDTNDLSVVSILQDLLAREARGMISPLAYDTRQTLKSFIDFCLGEFSGYNYVKSVKKTNGGNPVDNDQVTVKDLLNRQDGELYVGIQYGRAGLVIKGWRNFGFMEESLTVSLVPRGWQYLPLGLFQKLSVWAMDPEHNDLKGIEWQGKPFGAVNLYRVAKTAGADIFIGIKGGLSRLQEMTEEEFIAKEMWEVSSVKKSANWFSGEEYCQVVESKNLREVLDKY